MKGLNNSILYRKIVVIGQGSVVDAFLWSSIKLSLRTFVLIFLLTITLSSRAEFSNSDYSKVDSLALTIDKTNNLKKLSKRLTEKFSNDDEKYRAIFTWISHNISYDCTALKNRVMRTSDPGKVLKQGKAVCAGYASLFEELCRLANLECETISGWAKTSPLMIGKNLSKNPNHAWNAIKIDNKWYLCDVTWAAGYVSNNSSIFNFQFKDHYFCVKPELFASNHFPKKRKWLLGAKMSKNKFVKSPFYYGNALKLGIRNPTPNRGVISYIKGKQITIQFDVHKNVEIDELSISISSDRYSKPVAFTRSGNTISFTYQIEKYGRLLIYANNDCILVYKMVKNGS